MSTVLGIYQSKTEAEEALTELENNDIPTKNISVIARETDVYPKGSDTGTNVAQGATTGAGTGAVIGGLAGLLIGIGVIAIPGIGGLLIAGPLAAALGLTGAAATTASGAVTGAMAGGVVGALVGLGVPKEEAEVYENRLKEGAVILAASADDVVTEDDIREIFESTGATQIRSVG